MSIATEIQRINTAKSGIKTAIENKGVSVPDSAKIDSYPDYIDQITGGGSVEYEPGFGINIESNVISAEVEYQNGSYKTAHNDELQVKLNNTNQLKFVLEDGSEYTFNIYTD